LHNTPKSDISAPHGEKISILYKNMTQSISECKVLQLVSGKEGLRYWYFHIRETLIRLHFYRILITDTTFGVTYFRLPFCVKNKNITFHVQDQFPSST